MTFVEQFGVKVELSYVFALDRVVLESLGLGFVEFSVKPVLDHNVYHLRYCSHNNEVS
jgi:hypothetical protein